MIEIKNPSKMTEGIVQKLEYAFSIGADVSAACYYANISRTSYYNWIENFPEVEEKFNRLREKPVLEAYETISKNLDQVNVAKWFLERKRKKEFSIKIESEISSLQVIPSIAERDAAKAALDYIQDLCNGNSVEGEIFKKSI